MTLTLSPESVKLLGAVRRNFELLVELEKTHPHDVELIVASIVQHVRSWKPMALLDAQLDEARRG